MKPMLHICKPLLATVVIALTACADDNVFEKGGPVTAEGFVDLSPPTSYSPARGILCEEYSLAADGSATGECYDTTGPSAALTRKHVSTQAAETLLTDINNNRFENPRRFKTRTGMVCDLGARTCWLERNGRRIKLPKHTKALFWAQGD